MVLLRHPPISSLGSPPTKRFSLSSVHLRCSHNHLQITFFVSLISILMPFSSIMYHADVLTIHCGLLNPLFLCQVAPQFRLMFVPPVFSIFASQPNFVYIFLNVLLQYTMKGKCQNWYHLPWLLDELNPATEPWKAHGKTLGDIFTLLHLQTGHNNMNAHCSQGFKYCSIFFEGCIRTMSIELIYVQWQCCIRLHCKGVHVIVSTHNV